MYNAQSVVENIQAALKASGISQKKMLADCGISENALNQMNDKRGMSSFYLARIADYLHVSVDSLLGRDTSNDTEIPNADRDTMMKYSALPDNVKASLACLIDELSMRNS